MAMSQDEWKVLLREIGIPYGNDLESYAASFSQNAMDKQLLLMVDTQGLKDLGVTRVGHQMRIIKYIKATPSDNSTSKKTYKISDLMNKLKMNVSPTEFDRFESVWKINKKTDWL